MDGPKLDIRKSPQKDADQLTEKDTAIKLAHEKVGGDKMQLLEELLVEGKNVRAPYIGSHAINTEVTLSTQELLTSAVTASASTEIEAAKALDPFEKKDIITRALELRPNLSVGEVKAACEMLEINPDPFVERMIDVKTDKFFEQVEQDRRAHSPDRIIHTIEYQPEEDLKMIQEHFRTKFGHTISEHISDIFPKEGDILQVMVALEGRAKTRDEALQRLISEVDFENAFRKKRPFWFLQSDRSELLEAEANIAKALELLKNTRELDREEKEDDEEFLLLLNQTRSSITKYRKSQRPNSLDTFEIASILIAIICIIAIFAVGATLSRTLLMLIAAVLLFHVWAISRTRARAIRKRVLRSLENKKLSYSQKRAILRSRKLRGS